jgi:hypothetical protein
LNDLRNLADPQPRGILGLPQLDRLLEIFRAPGSSSAVQHPQRTSPVSDEGASPSNSRGGTPARGRATTSPSTSRARPSVIQLSSTHSAAGKTSLCYLITTLAVLPQAFNGKARAAVWFDTDGRFSSKRLEAVLIGYLSTHFPRLDSDERNAICHDAFPHLHVLHPQSSFQLLCTLASLPGYLLGANGTTTHFSALRSLDLIVLDSATSFYWQDRFEAEVSRFEALGTGENRGARTTTRPSRTLEVISELKRLQKLLGCTIVFTSTPPMTSSSMTISTATSITANDRRLLPQETPRVSPWTAFATLNLSISKEQVRQFAAQMSLEECQRDQVDRLAAIAKGCSIISVDWITSDTWGSGVRDAVNRLNGQGSFAIRITSNGVAVEG